jgi:hypothetical protein
MDSTAEFALIKEASTLGAVKYVYYLVNTL